MSDHARNLRRLMAQQGLTVDQVVRRTGLDERTIKGILSGNHQPQARTLHRLAAGLDVSVDELFQDPSLLVHKWFDRRTNPLVEEVVTSHPEMFRGWGEADFDELYSRFGAGGALTAQGVIAAARSMSRHREVCRKVAVLLESSVADLLEGLIEVMYEKTLVRDSSSC